jgi:hypothetical protein
MLDTSRNKIHRTLGAKMEGSTYVIEGPYWYAGEYENGSNSFFMPVSPKQ